MTLEPRWVTVDPGEDTGLSVWEGPKLIYADTLKMHTTGLLFYYLLCDPDHLGRWVLEYPEAEPVAEQLWNRVIERVVCEDWKLYPWVMYTPDGRATHALDFDQCRTARLIGKIDLCCDVNDIPFFLQGADIKETAVAAGAENLYYKPLHENRHQNDAIQHGTFHSVIHLEQAPVDARV